MMIKLIGGTAGLLVETGRWRGMAREVRVRKECRSGEVEDVEHWLLRCAAWKTFQKPLLARVQQLQEGGHVKMAASYCPIWMWKLQILSMISDARFN